MCREFTTIERNEPLQKESLKRFMVVLLKIEGNCSTFRAKLAHFVGHLPERLRTIHVVNRLKVRTDQTQSSEIGPKIRTETDDDLPNELIFRYTCSQELEIHRIQIGHRQQERSSHV